MVIQLAAGILRCRPAVPAVGLVEDRRVAAALQGGHGGLVVFEPVEVLEEQQPGGLLGVVELGAAAGLLAQAVVDGAERLLKRAGGGGAGTVRGMAGGGRTGALAVAGGFSRRPIRQGHRTTPATAGHDQPTTEQVALHRFVTGFVPLQRFPQAAVAR